MATKKNTIDTSARPKVSVFRSNKFITAQVIDASGKTIFGLTSKSITDKIKPVEKAEKLGKMIAEEAKKHKITAVVYDRNGLRYHGQVAALANGIRVGGLTL